MQLFATGLPDLSKSSRDQINLRKIKLFRINIFEQKTMTSTYFHVSDGKKLVRAACRKFKTIPPQGFWPDLRGKHPCSVMVVISYRKLLYQFEKKHIKPWYVHIWGRPINCPGSVFCLFAGLSYIRERDEFLIFLPKRHEKTFTFTLLILREKTFPYFSLLRVSFFLLTILNQQLIGRPHMFVVFPRFLLANPRIFLENPRMFLENSRIS